MTTTTAPQLVLASSSPRRRELLTQIGFVFAIETADIDESRQPRESAQAYVCRVARDKALAVAERGNHCLPVLGADTIVLIDDEILGKPRDPAEAEAMLARLSGRQHEVLTAVSLVAATHAKALSRTRVWFRTLSAAERSVYVSTGEPMDKAGGYGIQGRAAVFVERIDGSYSGVVGLPLCETAILLTAAGIDRTG